MQSTKCMGVVDLWKKFQHSNVVQLREVFTTKSFGDQCKWQIHNSFDAIYCLIDWHFFPVAFLALVLVYDYHPGSQTLLAKYFTPTSDTNNYQDPFQGEARPFRYIIQSVYLFFARKIYRMLMIFVHQLQP